MIKNQRHFDTFTKVHAVPKEMNKLNIKLDEEVKSARELKVVEKVAKPTHIFLAEYRNEQVQVEASCFEQLK